MAVVERALRVSLPTEVERALRQVESKLTSFKVSDFVNQDLFGPAVHLLNKQGKLLRPTLLLLGSHLVEKNPSDYIDLAVAAEMLHVASLIHDDIIDRDHERRDLKAVHEQYGREAALLAGDALIAKAVAISSKYGENVLNAMAKASVDMCAGELLDYNLQKSNKMPSVSKCINIDMLKSASLIATCCNIAAVHSDSPMASRIHGFGQNLGVAFQIRDDIIDYGEWAGKGRKGALIPNIVSSLESENALGSSEALDEARAINSKYVKDAMERLGEGSAAELMKDYAGLVMIKA